MSGYLRVHYVDQWDEYKRKSVEVKFPDGFDGISIDIEATHCTDCGQAIKYGKHLIATGVFKDERSR